MNILVTGAAGFIGYHLITRLLINNHNVMGIDNINDYYDVSLKYARLQQLGIKEESASEFLNKCKSEKFSNFTFVRINLEDKIKLPEIFNSGFDIVVNLAAQVGVRYSLENPEAYIKSNIDGFANLLECCRHSKIKHLVYASSSSVYGQNQKIPFSTDDNVDQPISLYAATKKSNELMAYTYSHLYGFKTTGLRFFTVYGPMGRPDMAMFLFTDAIKNGKPIKVFNHGKLERDFTHVDDIVSGLLKVIEQQGQPKEENYSIYNIGYSEPVKLLDFINEIEEQLGVEAQKEMLPMQPGDVNRTWADVTPLKQKFGYEPKVSIKDGVKDYVSWYKGYYNRET